MPDPEFPEIVTDSPALPHIGAARSSVHRAKGSEMMAVWGLLGVLAFAGAGYAIRVALQDEPPKTEPVAKAAPEPEPAIAALPARRTPPARRKVEENRAERPAAVVEKTVETPKKIVDPLEGFETGEAFDNPPSPGKYGRRTSNLAPPINGARPE